MKLITAILFSIFFFKAQSQQVEMIHDMDSLQQQMLLPFPNDSQKFICVQQFFANWEYHYELLEMNSIGYSQLNLLELTEITSEPITFNEVIVFAGESTTKGEELFIFDGSNTHLIDIQSGSESSFPELTLSNGRLFIVARIGLLRQLFELKNDLTLIQITEESPIDVRQFIINKDDDIYYSTNLYDTTYNYYGIDSMFNIKKINELSQIVTPLFSKKGSRISTPVSLNQNIYFVLEYSGITPPPEIYYSTKKVYRVNSDNSYELMLSDSSEQEFYNRSLFVYENSLYCWSDVDSILLSSSDGITLNLALDFGDSLLLKEVILENNICHLILNNGWTDNFRLHSFSNNSSNQIFSFDYHGHYLTEKDGHRFYVTFPSPASSDQNAYLIEINMLNDNIDTFHITDNAMHPPYFFGNHHGAVWIGNSFYFIYGNMMNTESQDIYRFDSSLGLHELNSEYKTYNIYPNPSTDYLLNFDTYENGIVNLLTLEGRIIDTFDVGKGHNELLLDQLSPGTYFIMQNGKSKKLIIE